MRLSLALICLVSAGTCVHSFGGAIYKIPSIYTPISSSNQYMYPPQFANPSQQSTSSSLFNYLPSPYPHYQPNSLILVYYRAKPRPVPVPAEPVQQSHLATNVCKREGITTHPNDCFKFLSCKLSPDQQAYFYEVRPCPKGLAFDPSLETCNYQSRVLDCTKRLSSSSSTKTSSASYHPTQTLLTYHNDLLPESTKESDKPESLSGDAGSSDPSLYMLDFPQSLSVDENRKQEFGANQDAFISTNVPAVMSVPTEKAEKECDCEKVKSTIAPVQATKKVSNTRKSSTRKVNIKGQAKVTKSSNNSSSTSVGGVKSPVQQTKIAESGRKKPRVETFSIGDSSESAKMVMDKEVIPEVGAANAVVDPPVPESAVDEPVPGDKLVAGVTYENNEEEGESAESGDNYSPTV